MSRRASLSLALERIQRSISCLSSLRPGIFLLFSLYPEKQDGEQMLSESPCHGNDGLTDGRLSLTLSRNPRLRHTTQGHESRSTSERAGRFLSPFTGWSTLCPSQSETKKILRETEQEFEAQKEEDVRLLLFFDYECIRLDV